MSLMNEKERELFYNYLADEYRRNPGDVAATALWKTNSMLQEMNCKYHCCDGGKCRELKAADNDKILLWWKDKHQDKKVDLEQLNNYKFVVINEKRLDQCEKEALKDVVKYFKLGHDLNFEEKAIPEGFQVKKVDIDKDIKAVSDFICSCYENIKPDMKTVESWTKHKVFNNNLWIWIEDAKSGEKAALGIADLDERIGELSLEWIQVHEKYRGKRLGSAIVNQILSIGKESGAEFATVSGEVDNETKPERLYRKCGFKGDDIWYVIDTRNSEEK